jgi:hypothetical protein
VGVKNLEGPIRKPFTYVKGCLFFSDHKIQEHLFVIMFSSSDMFWILSSHGLHYSTKTQLQIMIF